MSYWKKKLQELNAEDKAQGNYWEQKMSELETRTSQVDNTDVGDIAPVKLTEQEQQMGGGSGFFQRAKSWDDVDNFWEGLAAFGQTTIGSAADLGVNILKGAGRTVEGLTDLAGHGIAGIADLIGQDEWADDFRDDVNRSLVDEIAAPADEFLDNYSIFGNMGDAVGEGLGQVATVILTGGAAGAVGAGAVGVTAATTGTIGLSAMGSGMSEAYLGGATDGEAVAYGVMKGIAEAGSELLFGGLGRGINALGFSRGILSVDDALAKALSSKISNQLAKNAVQWGVKASAEGVEEVVAGWLTAHAKKLSYKSEEDWDQLKKDERLLESFVIGAVTSGIAQSGIVPGMRKGSLIETTKQGKDFISGLRTDTEQKVVDKVFNDAVAEKEANGEKLSAKEKTELYDKVLNDLEKGYISTDTIEEVLGDDVYKSYKDTIDYEDDILRQYEELGKKTNPTLAEMSLYDELKSQYNDIKQNSQREYLKANLSQEVQNKVKDSKLAESYNEKARRGQVYEADLSQYDEKQQEVIKRAVESGILNNTNRTHEFVDLIAKISADKGVLFDFTNNKKLKESGFAIDGKEVNGYVTKDGVTLNIDSHKALQSTVGHEITHVLEGTELYAEMQKALFDYAKSKGDFDGRRQSLAELYKDVEGSDVDAELTADLVGDYLFTDENFVKQLSAQNRNVFQKIYDEIKYLWKLATAGGKEARELEKVKRAFDKAYKESGKASKGTKYALDMVEAVKPTNNKWTQSATTDEVRAAHPTLYAVDETATEERNPTQVKGTVGSYRKVYESLRNEGFNGTILDASSGLGYGTKAGIEEYGFDVEDIEPYPDSGYKPKYTDYSALNKKYDVVISNAVLNVLPQDQRDALTVKMGELLNPGGRMFVNVRGKDVLNASGKIAINESNMEYFIPRTAKTGSYQKGFTKSELVAYLEDALGDGYTVKPTNMFGAVSAIVTKDGAAKYSISDKKTIDKYSQKQYNDFGWARYTEAVTENELDDMYSKIHEKGSLKKFHQTKYGESVIEVNDSPHIIEANNTFVFVKGSKNNPEITRVVRVNFYDEASIDVFRKDIYENTDNRSLEAYARVMGEEIVQYYDRSNSASYREYSEQSESRSSGSESKGNQRDARRWDLGDTADTKTQSNDITPNKASSKDGVFFDGKKQYSLSEYTAEEKKAHNDAVLKHFGKTYKWAETGYLLLDGSKLDLSGKHDGAPGGYRTVDHRDITEALGYDYGGGDYSGSLVQFMSEGNIRIVPEIDGINLSVKPTKAQEQALSDFISRARGEVVLDIDDLNGYTVVSVEYPRGTYYTKVLNDIREWFDNGKQPETSGLSAFRSLTKKGEPQKRYGNYNIYGKDVRYEAPMQEQVAPVVDISKTETVENFAPMPSEPTSYELRQEQERLIEEAKKATDAETAQRLYARYNELEQRAAQLEAEEAEAQSESLAHLTDADVPPEMEAPYYGETQDAAPIDPFEDRNMKEVSRDRKTPAYMYENPEVKPFFQAEANILLGELERVEKPETYYNGWLKQGLSYEANDLIPEIYRTSRVASDTIVYLRDTIGMSYADIEKGLKAIIEDNGAENIAAAKKLEFVINDRLLYGYNDDGGFEIPANQDYINLLTEKEISEYSDEARKQFFDVADAYAPQEDIAPVAEAKAAPVKEAYEAIKPQKQAKEPSMKRVKDADDIAPTEIKTAEIYDTEPETGKKKSRGWARFRANFLDKQSVFEDLALKTKNRELMGKANYILSAERRAQRLIGKGKSSAGVKSLNDIRAEVESTGKTKQFYEYLYHRHNIDRMSLEESKPVFGDTVTADVSRAEVAKYEAENPKFTEYAQDVYDYMNYLRDQMVESGVISQETANLWSQMYPHYVPIRRLGDTGLNINVPLDTGRTGVNAPIKRATGGSRDILPLFDTMALRTEQTYKAIAKNNFGVELKNTLGSTIESAKANLDEMIDSVDAHEELLKKGENGKNPTFTVFEDGKKVTFEITEDMYDALKPTSEDLRSTNKVANTISNVHRGLLTEYNPTFMLTNAVKDVQDVLINSQHPAKTYANMPNAIMQMAKNGAWYQEYLENGGESNTYFDGQSNTFTKDDTGIKKIIGMPLRAISAANNYIERAPRLAEYIASRKAGASAEVAMLDAARVTTNFAAGGDVTKWANRNGFTFLNASVQGAMQQVRNVREAKANGLKGWVQLATKVAIAGIPAMILNNLLWDDDEEYEQLSDYVKDNYYVVAKYGDGKFVRIPKGRAMAVIQDAFEQVGNALTGNDEVDLKNFLELAISNLAPTNPLESNIIAPISQALTNKTWYGEDLVPTRLQDLPAAEQFDESTDSISKWLGEKLDVSPYKLNYLLNQYSGGVGDVVLPMLTPEAESGDNSLVGNLIAPLRDKFTTDSVMKNQNVSDFYDTVDKLTANAKSSYATDEDILKSKYMNSVNAELSELYKQKREIQNSNLADAEKYEAVRDIQKQIDMLAEESLNTYGNVNIDGGYAVVGDRYYKLNDNGEWVKITDKQLEKQEDVTSGLGIDPSTYWENKSEYDFAYEYPEKYALAKSIGGYESYKTYTSDLYDIKADKDEDGKSISGSRKDKVADYINGLDISYEEKIILFKSEYNADDTYNYEIIEYLNNRNDISYDEMVAILKELGFTVKGDTITWD